MTQTTTSGHRLAAALATTLALAFIAAFAVACTRGDEAGQLGRARAGGLVAQAAVGPRADRQIIRSADVAIEVRDIDAARADAEAVVATRQGYLESVHETQDSLRLQFRIPVESLDEFLAELSGLGDVTRSSVTSRDVTEQHADLNVRLANNKKLRDRLVELLDQAKTVEEMLAVEKELARVQAEVESLQGRLDRLDGQVAMSSVSVTLERATILGPLGYIGYGVYWVIEKLFIIR